MPVIRNARPSELDAVLTLWEQAAGPTRLPSDAHSLSALLERDADALLIADEAGEVLATIIVGWDGWRCHLYRLAVRGDVRRHGLATDLVACARERARRLGARRLDAMVDDDNELAHRFWSAIGFTSGQSEDARWISPV